jgi:hypothetical protein
MSRCWCQGKSELDKKAKHQWSAPAQKGAKTITVEGTGV